jgi:hypothetical protein
LFSGDAAIAKAEVKAIADKGGLFPVELGGFAAGDGCSGGAHSLIISGESPGGSFDQHDRLAETRMFSSLKPFEHGDLGCHDFSTVRRIFTRDGGRWGLAQIHAILTRTTYIGEHRFNTRSHESREKKPESEVAIMAAPPLIDRKTFDAVQARLKSRQPMVTPARVSSGPTLLTGICFCAKCGGAMTLRTGKGNAGGMYRYYTCSMKARQGKIGCVGRSISMDRLDTLVAGHIEDRLLQPERLEAVLASVLDRRQERTERRREHLAELNRRITETEQRLNRLYDAIESGVADLDDAVLKERIAGLKAIWDQARADAERVQTALGNAGNQAVSPDMIKTFAHTAREWLRMEKRRLPP